MGGVHETSLFHRGSRVASLIWDGTTEQPGDWILWAEQPQFLIHCFFLHAVLVEKLWRCQPDVGHLYLLIQPTETSTAENRLNDIVSDYFFQVAILATVWTGPQQFWVVHFSCLSPQGILVGTQVNELAESAYLVRQGQNYNDGKFIFYNTGWPVRIAMCGGHHLLAHCEIWPL